jgi:ribosomal protein L11 methyltransferase
MTDSLTSASRFAVALLRCPQRHVAKIADELVSWPACQGLEEVPDADASFYVPSEDFEILEFGSEAAEKCAEWLDSGAFQRGRSDIFLKVYFALEDTAHARGLEDFNLYLDSHGKRLPRGLELISWAELPNTDYLENYKKSVQGVSVGQSLWVGPPWSTPDEGRRAIVVEPGMAFGTGDHPTTQMCLEILEELAKNTDFRPQRIYDIGTGSGVLSVAARYFFPTAEIVMTDLDPLCEREVQKTFQLNALPFDRVQLVCGPRADLKHMATPWPQGDLLISNIYAEVLASLLPELAKLLRPGALWVVSGLLEGPATLEFESQAAKCFKLEDSRTRIRERPLLEVGKGLSSEEEAWGGRLFRRL